MICVSRGISLLFPLHLMSPAGNIPGIGRLFVVYELFMCSYIAFSVSLHVIMFVFFSPSFLAIYLGT